MKVTWRRTLFEASDVWLKRLTLSTILKASEHAVNRQILVAISENLEFLLRKNDLACPHLVFINDVLTFLDLLR